jgi:hypothetical protein
MAMQIAQYWYSCLTWSLFIHGLQKFHLRNKKEIEIEVLSNGAIILSIEIEMYTQAKRK